MNVTSAISIYEENKEGEKPQKLYTAEVEAVTARDVFVLLPEPFLPPPNSIPLALLPVQSDGNWRELWLFEMEAFESPSAPYRYRMKFVRKVKEVSEDWPEE